MATKPKLKLKSKKAEKLFTQYDERLKDIKSIDINDLGLEDIEELYKGFELEMYTLYSKKSSILSMETRASLKDRYLMQIHQYREIVRITRPLKELSYAFPERNIKFYTRRNINNFEFNLSRYSKEFHSLNSNVVLSESLKQKVLAGFDSEIQRITNHFINNLLPVEFMDSIELIEKTLAEPEFFTLPHLIMWRETAEQKIEIIQNRINPKIPQPVEDSIVNKYKTLIKQLKAEILKLRTYPIPEPWCSECMRKGLTHMIKGEFIFFVHPSINEDIRQLKLSERDLLPGGITREQYDHRLNRLNMEIGIAMIKLEDRSATDLESKVNYLEVTYGITDEHVQFAFTELQLLYRDELALEYLVNKNDDDELLKEIYEILLRNIRHYYSNRVDIPSLVIDFDGNVARVAPPNEERKIPTASGIDRGGTEAHQLVTPAAVIVVEDAVIVADRYGHLISIYRANDLAPTAWYHEVPLDTPVSMTLHKSMLYVCYSNELVQFSLFLEDSTRISLENSISIPQACCVASNSRKLFVGTLKPSIILMNAGNIYISKGYEYTLNPIQYYTKNKNRFPWLQDMKAVEDSILCLFTGSPSPLQMFSLEGELIKSILTEDHIVGAYHFALYYNLVTAELRIYITDFWDSSIKVFDMEGRSIETFCEKGFELGQIFHPTGIFVEYSGYITICDMKEDNCLQRL